MSATITHKGSTVTTVSNATKKLTTKGTWLEDDITIVDSTPTLGTKSISSNGTYNASSDSLGGYSQVSVSVPNTYAAGDEGKVVDNGALVSQSTATYSSNNTYDTTKIKTVTVAVPGSSPNLQAKTNISPLTSSQTIQADTGYDGLSSVQINAMPTQTLPTSASSSGSGTTKATISRSTSDQYINIPTGYNATAANYKVSAVANGTAGTPTASKGTVSNHSVSVTPSVTNTTGYITGSTKTGTAVTVTASELASGNKEITSNGSNIDVVGYSTVSVSVSGGGGSGITEDVVEAELNSTSSTLTFTGLLGEPTAFAVYLDDSISTPSGTPYRVTMLVYDGTTLHGQTLTNTSNAQVTYDGSSFSKSYSNGTLTITSTGAQFVSGTWIVDYTYGGTSGNIQKKDVQVGSGATSITFTDLEDEPLWWSLIFKSNFGTSSGYQRVIAARYSGYSDNIWGYAMDSNANFANSWTDAYSNGSLTITSSGTNNGGYFHQPGYYQLTYALSEAPEITIEPLSVTQNGTYSESGKAYSPVTVNVSGGGSSKNAQVAQSTNRVTATTATAISGFSITVAETGTYDVYWSAFRSSTSGTWSTQLYVAGTAYGSSQTSWSNHIQNVHLTNVSLTKNQTVQVYGVSRGSNYYLYGGTLTIIQN